MAKDLSFIIGLKYTILYFSEPGTFLGAGISSKQSLLLIVLRNQF